LENGEKEERKEGESECWVMEINTLITAELSSLLYRSLRSSNVLQCFVDVNHLKLMLKDAHLSDSLTAFKTLLNSVLSQSTVHYTLYFETSISMTPTKRFRDLDFELMTLKISLVSCEASIE